MQRAEAVRVHPVTGDRVWFNQVQLHHPSFLEADERQAMLSLFGENGLPRNVVYGDGTPIPDEVMHQVGELYDRLAVSFTWQKADMVMLDNMLVAHSRSTYVGPRKIVVAMGEMTGAESE
jgi:alpha-ketoglutarate-dependent taurine dioxygenase